VSFGPTHVRADVLLYAPRIADLLALYTHIRIERSPSGYGPWSPLTTAAQEPAELSCDRPGPYQALDRTLVVELPDATRLDHIFTTPDPARASDLATELNLASPLLNCYADGDTLVLRTVGVGNGAYLKILGGDATPNLSLYMNDTAFGTDEHIALVPGQALYTLSDLHGDPDYGYSYRFINPPAESERRYTVPNRELVTALHVLSVGYARVVGLDGMALSGAIATITNRFIPPSVGGYLIARGESRIVGHDGQVWFPLVRGAKVEFSVSGTALNRIVTVPDQDEFDLLDPSLSPDDPWGIVVTPYTSLPRTTP
jgi:hypothetical protein